MYATTLHPIAKLLAPNEIVQRMKQEFKVVDASFERGHTQVEEIVKYWRSVRGRRSGDRLKAVDERIANLLSSQHQSVAIRFCDDPDSRYGYQETLLRPGENIVFGYENREHEKASRPLITRAARVLGYEALDS